jgi:hypothetical protein
LGSAVVEQGVDFFNVREVHIIDPWHHMNRIEQVVGRAIRRNSHERLEESKHNVSVYLHCATIASPQEFIESSDERTYRNAYNKAIKIAHVARILKQGALDCLINKNANQLTVERFNYTMRPIITSQNVAIHNPLPPSYYHNAFQEIMKHIPNPFFVLVSDDPSYWDTVKIPGYHTCIDEPNSAITLYFMTHFKNYIIANSSFAWWGAFLSKHTNPLVIAPEKWFGPAGFPDYQDIYEPEWIKVSQ